ncbi:MAG TPA: VWA domain-containing protein [Thermoanaerobaculia bacterium]|jgi:VWFA-related protein|nr:VWA domain-containing protein [Thermoanaerobaculia bacterium]
MRRFLTAVVSFALFAVPCIYAQNFGPLPPLTAHVDVNVVNVDVTVTDRSGKPVMNLSRGDFEIYEDGKLMNVSNFSAIEHTVQKTTTASAPASAEQQAPAAAPLHRKLLILIDNNYLEKQERDRAIKTIEKYLQSSEFQGEWALAAIGHTIMPVQLFTSDKALLHAAFEKVRQMPVNAVYHEIDRSILSDRSRKILDFGSDYDYGEAIRFNSREQTFRNVMTLRNTARAVADMAASYSADEGKKFMILVTGGMESNTSYTSYDKSTDRQMEQLRLDMAKIVDAMVREANAANFTIHVVNAKTRGMQAPQHDVENRSSGINLSAQNIYLGKWGDDPIDTTDLDSIPLSVALGTGGMYLPSANLTESIQRIDTQTSNFYSLGYTPAHSGDRRYHTIKVKVKRPGVMVANRVGYYDLSPDDRLEESLHARLTFDHPIGELPVQIKLGTPRSNDRNIVLPVQAALPMANVTLLPRDSGFVGRVHIYLSVFDRNGRNVGFHHQTQEVTMTAKEHEKQGEEPFKYSMNLRLKKGDFTVVVTMRDELSNEMGSIVRDVSL